MDTASPAADARAAVTLEELLELLDLKCSDDGADDPSARVTHWVGQPQTQPADRIFGGLLLAQALVAAGRVAGADQRIISLQADFVGGVPTDRPLRWEVTAVSDAPSLATRSSRLLDDAGEELFSAVTRWGDDAYRPAVLQRGRVESIAHGRAHGVGEVFDAAGRHVATASQVGLVKAPPVSRPD